MWLVDLFDELAQDDQLVLGDQRGCKQRGVRLEPTQDLRLIAERLRVRRRTPRQKRHVARRHERAAEATAMRLEQTVGAQLGQSRPDCHHTHTNALGQLGLGRQTVAVTQHS
jgi:hypothetical protein